MNVITVLNHYTLVLKTVYKYCIIGRYLCVNV